MSGRVPVLMYHSITEDPPAATRALSVGPADLERQLRFVRDNGFTGLTFGNLCVRVRTGVGLPARPVVLTFDDGYADVHTDALPLLARYGFPATVFVTTGWIRDVGRWAAGRPLDQTLAWTQVRELADAGTEIAAHGHSHTQLDQLDETTLRVELSLGKALLEDRLGAAVPSVAYPFGYSSRRVREAAAAAGYDQAAAVGNAAAGAGGDAFAVPRLRVRRSTAPVAFAQIAFCERLDRLYGLDRALTAGWSVVRRSRRSLCTLRAVRGA
jgi:peptidoglycan/xylan/chitin deacetylase (PgdA/CDA1 family)